MRLGIKLQNQDTSAINAPKYQEIRVAPEHFKWEFSKKYPDCMICGRKKDIRNGRLIEISIDHNHENDQIRGRLCRRCNMGLGCFFDNPRLLAKAIIYIKRPRLYTPFVPPEDIVKKREKRRLKGMLVKSEKNLRTLANTPPKTLKNIMPKSWETSDESWATVTHVEGETSVTFSPESRQKTTQNYEDRMQELDLLHIMAIVNAKDEKKRQSIIASAPKFYRVWKAKQLEKITD